jgi:hypothetical protein
MSWSNMGKHLCHELVKYGKTLVLELVKSHHGREEPSICKRENVESDDERQHEPVVHQEAHPLLEAHFSLCL